MTTKPFEHNFNKDNLNVNEIAGYTQAMRSLFLYLAERTEYKPEKRMVDAVEMLESIENVNEELKSLLLVALQDAKKKEAEYYTYADIDVSNPTKIIAGQDALLDNPVYERNGGLDLDRAFNKFKNENL